MREPGRRGCAAMKYVFQFGIVWDHLPQLLNGAWLTIRLSLGAFAVGFAIGIRFEAITAALIGMSLNFSGYGTEIIRSGIEAVPRSQIEAGYSLGFTRLQIFRQIIVFPALRTVYPALGRQFVLLMLGSSIVAAISAEELTAVVNSLQSTTFRAFEFYFVATAMYLLMAIGARLLLHAIYWAVFEQGRPLDRAWARGAATSIGPN